MKKSIFIEILLGAIALIIFPVFHINYIQANNAINKNGYVNIQAYEKKDYHNLFNMPGFNKNLIKLHISLYEGYVKNANLLLQKLRVLNESSKIAVPEYEALKKSLGWEYNGMKMHEMYFDYLGGNGVFDQKSSLYKELVKQYGGFDLWKKDFVSTGMIRGIGWVVLYLDPKDGKLLNVWVKEHDEGNLFEGIPLLVMDVFEHAYMPQFGLNRMHYIDIFFQNVDWEKINQHFEDVLSGFSIRLADMEKLHQLKNENENTCTCENSSEELKSSCKNEGIVDSK